jgi:ElaB/YqjD/DUF883 family membrane-anchored ribosome-binding protein
MANYNPPNTGAGIAGEAGTTYGREDSGRVTTSTSTGEGDKGAGVTGAIGSRLEKAGDYLEEKGKAAFVSDRLHSAGRYLQENDVRSITRSVDEAICAHPYRSMLVGLGMGWVIGKFLSR